MKYLTKLILSAFFILVFISCKKVADLPFYKSGKAPVLTSSVTAVAAVPADSLNPVLTLSWSFPEYATDSANMKYVVEIDSAGRNFSHAATRTILGDLSTTFTAKELNTILLGYGFSFGVPYNIDIKVTSSYANNNERLASNVITLMITPYAIPPKVAPPASGHLYLVGDASQGGWNNPVPVPTQEFSKLDSVTYGGIFDLIGGKQYLALPVNGDWTHKFSVADNSVAGLSDGEISDMILSKIFPGPLPQVFIKSFLTFNQANLL